MKMRVKIVPGKVVLMFCIASFLAGSLFTSSQTWSSSPALTRSPGEIDVPKSDCEHKRKLIEENVGAGDVMGQVATTRQAIESLDKTIYALETEVALTRTRKPGIIPSVPSASNHNIAGLEKVFAVIGINTAFSSRKRRDSIRETWMPRGERLKKLEKEKGIVMRFVIGHSTSAIEGEPGVLDQAIDAEEAETKDFLRLKHVEGYHELSTKTRVYFSTAISIWDADFYVKVDDDVHLNLGMLASTLARYRDKPRIYMGCMKTGPVLFQKGLRYHEPEFWKFGEEGNKYFRHATGQIYAISKDLATYISSNSEILHRYANEDVSLGSWLIGLDVEHVNERSMCCGTPPDCELRTKAGNVCVASFDWECSGICKSVERMNMIHSSCGEEDETIWSVDL